jgi:nucleotide-binding universal stress UspA family protein
MKILLAVDGSACSDAAVFEVAARPWPEGSEVRVISVVEPIIPVIGEAWAFTDTNYLAEAEKIASDRARDATDKATATLSSAAGGKLKLSSEVILGSPREVILDEADHWRANLVVVGSHGYRGLTRFLLGSVSQAIASHAKCSVEIVRCPEALEEQKQ